LNLRRGIDELMERGTAMADKGNFEEALAHVREAIQKDNLYAPAYYLAGVILENLGEYEKAVEEFKRALYIDHSLTICYFNLGNIFRFLGKIRDAKREYGNCLKFLEREEEEAEVLLTDGMTAGVLSQAAYRALGSMNAETEM